MPWIDFILSWADLVLPSVCFILPWRFIWLQIYFVVPRVEICFAVTFCFAVALVGHRIYPLLLNTILFYVFSNPVSWTTRNLMTLDPVSSLLLLPKLHLLGPWSVDQFMRGLSTQILHSLVCLNLNQRMVTYQRRMWCTPTYRVYKLWLINNKEWQDVLKSLYPSFNSDRNSKRIGTENFVFSQSRFCVDLCY